MFEDLFFFVNNRNFRSVSLLEQYIYENKFIRTLTKNIYSGNTEFTISLAYITGSGKQLRNAG